MSDQCLVVVLHGADVKGCDGLGLFCDLALATVVSVLRKTSTTTY